MKARDTGKRVILILEPRSDVAETIAELLQSSGYRAHVSQSIADGARWAECEAPDVVLADHELGLASAPRPVALVGVPIVEMGASGSPPIGVPWVPKPFSRAQLTAVLARVSGTRR